MKLKTTILSLAFLSLFFLFSCGDEKNNKSNQDDSATATITLDDGQELDFKSTFNTSASLMSQKFGIGFTNMNNGITVYMMIMSPKKLVPGTHDGYIKVSQMGKSNLIEETYDSHYNKGAETKKEGNSKLTITTMNSDLAQGTFSGTLYSKSGKKITIKDGVFNVKKKKRKNRKK
ncbi:hypothetical protein RBU60_03310 [Mesonia sp. MT50]|uniref:DUF4251 domain-containing protein n=1 Tax=Mesonia profundi TaxID=3070998 RepID=A0ABU0ZYQ7_9FLAO|nr:hypothetical protein [Mesonia profundi]MDQ7916591.1 hypothetical protein [Mesonia profundi]